MPNIVLIPPQKKVIRKELAKILYYKQPHKKKL